MKRNKKEKQERREKLTNKQARAVVAQTPPGVSNDSAELSVFKACFYCLKDDKNPDFYYVVNISVSAQVATITNSFGYWLCFFLIADNVLLSEDGRDTFLCDFGHAERLDNGGQSLSGSNGKYLFDFKALLVVVIQNCGIKRCFI